MIDGHGILAKVFIPQTTLIGISHIDITGITPLQGGGFHNGIIRTPLGGFLNHSPNPNCVLITGPVFWHLWTNEDIYIGDELCIDYALYRCGAKEECDAKD